MAMALAIPVWAVLFLSLPLPPDPLWPVNEPVMALRVVFLLPLMEEWIFRGVLQPMVGRRLHGVWYQISAANLATSLLFTALHFLSHPPLSAATVFAPSLVFGWLRDRTGSFLPSFFTHAWYNLGYFWITSGIR